MSCNCAGSVGCDCVIVAGQGVSVSGLGTSGDPYVVANTRPSVGVADGPSLDLTLAANVISGKVSLAPLLSVADTSSIDLALGGMGVEGSPFVLSGALKGVTLEPSTTGQVLTKKPDGSWGPGAATQAPAGSVSTSNGLFGDGSGGSPVRIRARTYAEWETVVDNAAF